MLVLLGLIKNGDILKGYMFYDLNKKATNKLVPIAVEKIKEYYNYYDMLGVKLDTFGKLESTECSLTRFATFTVDLRSEDIKNKIYILGYYDKDNTKIYKVIYNLSEYELSVEQIKGLLDKGKSLINGKLLNRGNNYYISAIKGSFPYMDKLEETATTKCKAEEVTKEVIKEENTTANTKQVKEQVNIVGDLELDCLAYSLMVTNRWLYKLRQFEELGRMFINYDMYMRYLTNDWVVNELQSRGCDVNIISYLSSCKDRNKVIALLVEYRDILKGLINRVDINKLEVSKLNEIDNILNTNSYATNHILNSLAGYIEIENSINTKGLLQIINKHKNINNYGYLYYLTVLGAMSRDVTTNEIFLRIYSYGKSLNEISEPISYTKEADMGYTVSQALLIGLGDSLGLTDRKNGE